MARGDTAEKDGGLGATGRLCAAEAVANPLTWHKIAPSYAPGAPPPCPRRPAVPRLARPSAPPARMRISPRVQPARQQSTEAIVSRPRRHLVAIQGRTCREGLGSLVVIFPYLSRRVRASVLRTLSEPYCGTPTGKTPTDGVVPAGGGPRARKASGWRKR